MPQIGWAKGFRPPTRAAARAAAGFAAEATPPVYDGSLFSPVPAPRNIDDWLAQYNVDKEDFAEWERFCRHSTRRAEYKFPCTRPIYLATLGEFGEDAPQLDELKAFVELYFAGVPVKLLPPIKLVRKPVPGKADTFTVFGRKVTSRVAHPYDIEREGFVGHNHVQLRVGDLLGGLSQQRPADSHCLIAVTMYDLYDGATDTFCAGMAAGGSGVGVFSFCRYVPGFSLFKAEKARQKQNKRKTGSSGASCADKQQLLLRSCKTLVHEIAHNFGIGHCVWYDCLMRGSGHLEEDFSIPMHLCPVDLRKFAAICGFDPVERYHGLLSWYRDHDWKAEAQWVETRLAAIGGKPKIQEEPSHEDERPSKRPRRACASKT